MKKTILSLLIVIFIALKSYGFEKVLTNVTKKTDPIVLNLDFLSRGPINFNKDETSGESYRIGFWREEIYYSLYVEKIQTTSDVNSGENNEKILSRWLLSGEELRDFLRKNGEVSVNMTFVKWESPTKFLIEIDKQAVLIEIKKEKQLKMFFKKP